MTVINNQVTLRLASALPSGAAPVVSYDGGNATNALRGEAGTLAAFTDAPVRNALSLTPSLATSFQPFTTLALAGAEITAFDKTSSKLFVTSDQRPADRAPRQRPAPHAGEGGEPAQRSQH